MPAEQASGGLGKLLYDLRHRRRRFRQFLGWLFVFAVSFLGHPTVPALFWSGVVVVVAGMAMRMWASGFVRKNQVLATNGPYARVRHPLYTGNLLICIGFSLASGAWWAWPVGIAFVALFYPTSIAYEDQKLRRLFPEEWEPWASVTPAIVPSLKPTTAASDDTWRWSFSQSLMKNGEPIYVLVMCGCLAWLWRLLSAG
ncbi:MAG: isoprenylcysteine carboxylmethyltransferase family protein [Planctomycetota bacterium]